MWLQLKSALGVVALNEYNIKNKKTQSLNSLYVVLSGLALFLGQLWATRDEPFPPAWWVFIYYGVIMVLLVFLFITITYYIARLIDKSVSFESVNSPLCMGTIILWITVFPPFMIVAIWYVVVAIYVVKTIYSCSVEQSVLTVGGSALITIGIYHILDLLLQFPHLYFYI